MLGPGDDTPKNGMVLFSSRAELTEVFEYFGETNKCSEEIAKDHETESTLPEVSVPKMDSCFNSEVVDIQGFPQNTVEVFSWFVCVYRLP